MTQAVDAPIHPAHHIDAFIDALWLEDGLSKNTLEAYRRDLTLYAQWLATRENGDHKGIDHTMEADINGYFSAKHSATKVHPKL